jgi:hypothetical protein
VGNGHTRPGRSRGREGRCDNGGVRPIFGSAERWRVEGMECAYLAGESVTQRGCSTEIGGVVGVQRPRARDTSGPRANAVGLERGRRFVSFDGCNGTCLILAPPIGRRHELCGPRVGALCPEHVGSAVVSLTSTASHMRRETFCACRGHAMLHAVSLEIGRDDGGAAACARCRPRVVTQPDRHVPPESEDDEGSPAAPTPERRPRTATIPPVGESPQSRDKGANLMSRSLRPACHQLSTCEAP